jgi:hypothetical protein
MIFALYKVFIDKYFHIWIPIDSEGSSDCETNWRDQLKQSLLHTAQNAADRVMLLQQIPISYMSTAAAASHNHSESTTKQTKTTFKSNAGPERPSGQSNSDHPQSIEETAEDEDLENLKKLKPGYKHRVRTVCVMHRHVQL